MCVWRRVLNFLFRKKLSVNNLAWASPEASSQAKEEKPHKDSPDTTALNSLLSQQMASKSGVRRDPECWLPSPGVHSAFWCTQDSVISKHSWETAWDNGDRRGTSIECVHLWSVPSQGRNTFFSPWTVVWLHVNLICSRGGRNYGTRDNSLAFQ